MVAHRGQRRRGRRAVGELAAEALLERLAEPLRAPLVDEELRAGARALEAVAVVAEQRRDLAGDLDRVLDAGSRRRAGGPCGPTRRARRRPTGRSRRPRSGASTPTRPMSLISCCAQWWRQLETATLYLRGRFEKRRLPTKLRDERVHDGARVEVLVGRDAGERAADDVAPHVAAGLRAGQPDLVEGREDVRHVLQPQPVQLDALARGDVGERAAVADREVGDRAQLPGVELPVRDAHPQHEVAVLLGPLRVDAPPLRERQVVRLERREAAVACGVDEIVDDVEPVLPLLDPLDLGAQVPFLGHASTSRWGWP